MRKVRVKSRLDAVARKRMLSLSNPAPVATFFKSKNWKNIVAGQKEKDRKNGVDAFGYPLKTL
jgi:hypothetical protein